MRMLLSIILELNHSNWILTENFSFSIIILVDSRVPEE